MHSSPVNGTRFCRSRRWLLGISVSASLFASHLATAAPVNLPDGHAALPGQFDHLTLEASGRTGDAHQRTGFRLSFPRYADHIVVFLETQSVEDVRDDIALFDDVDVSGRTTGGGIYITGLPQWRSFSLNLRLSGTSEELDVDSNIAVSGIQAQTTLKNRNVTAVLLMSPVTPVFDNGANVYFSLGASYQRTRRNVVLSGADQPELYRYDTDYQPHVAAGVVLPFKRFSFYASIDYEEKPALGLGIRLQLTR